MIVFVVIASFVSVDAKPCKKSVKKMEFENLINALIEVESSGNVKAIGDNGKAKGCLQIWDVVIKDVNQFYKTKYTSKDAFNKEKSKDICKKYLTYWGKIYKSKHGIEPSIEIYAKIWNAGPEGYKNPKTISYWNRVKSVLRNMA